MAKRASKHGVNISSLNPEKLVALKADIDKQLRGHLRSIEKNLADMRRAVGLPLDDGHETGNGRKASKAAKGGGETKGPRKGGVPFKALAAITEAGGPITKSDLVAKLRLGDKENQLGVALSNLKKGGHIKSAGHGSYKLA